MNEDHRNPFSYDDLFYQLKDKNTITIKNNYYIEKVRYLTNIFGMI